MLEINFTFVEYLYFMQTIFEFFDLLFEMLEKKKVIVVIIDGLGTEKLKLRK